jgi:hypothetical protein
MTDQDRARLQVAAVIGAVLGGATGYLITHQAGTGGWPKIVIWALIWRSRRQRDGLLSSGFSFVNALPSPLPAALAPPELLRKP